MFIKKNIPVILLLLFLVCIFYASVFLHPNYVLSPTPDITGQYSVLKEIFVKSFRLQHAFPLWNRYEFSGNPFLANSFTGIFYLPNLIYFLFPGDSIFGFVYAYDSFLIGIFTYFYARQIMKGKFGPLLAAICFMFSGTVVSRVNAGHVAHVSVIVWVVAAFLFLELYLKKRKNIFGILLSIVISLMILAGQMQVTFYGLFVLGVYCVFRLYADYIVTKSIKKILSMGLKIFLFVVLGVCLCAAQLLPTLEFSVYSIRGGGLPYLFASTYSIPLLQLSEYILPNIFGTPDVWWGRGNFWEFTSYIGVLPLFFAVYSFIKPNKYVYIFLSFTIFSLLFSLGSYGPMFKLFYLFVPEFNMFRIPATMLFVTSFSLSILAGFGVQKFIKLLESLKVKQVNVGFVLFLIGSLLSGLLLVFSLLYKSNIFAIYSKYLSKFSPGHEELFYKATIHDITTIFLITVFMAVATLYFGKFKNWMFLKITLIAIATLDLLLFSNLFIHTQPPSLEKNIRIDSYVSRHISGFKVFDMGTNSFTYLQKDLIPSVSGYSPTYLANYRDYMWRVGDHLNIKYEPFIVVYNIKNFTLLNMLGVKYIVSGNAITSNSVKLIMKEENTYLYLLNDTVSNAFVMHNAYSIPNDIKALDVVASGSFDEKKILLIDQKVSVGLRNSGDYEYAHANVMPNEITANVNTKDDGFFVLREVWYPGWKGYVNGKEVPVYKANYLFRAIPIRAGANKIRLIYDPFPFKLGLVISGFALVGILFYLFLYFKIAKYIGKSIDIIIDNVFCL